MFGLFFSSPLVEVKIKWILDSVFSKFSSDSQENTFILTHPDHKSLALPVTSQVNINVSAFTSPIGWHGLAEFRETLLRLFLPIINGSLGERRM